MAVKQLWEAWGCSAFEIEIEIYDLHKDIECLKYQIAQHRYIVSHHKHMHVSTMIACNDI